jgi:hypothetical protein
MTASEALLRERPETQPGSPRRRHLAPIARCASCPAPPRQRKGVRLLGRGVAAVQLGKAVPGCEARRVGGDPAARRHVQQGAAQLGPAALQFAVFLFQLRGEGIVAGGAQQRQHVAFLVLVVRRRGEVEVTHHVARRGLGLRVAAVHVAGARPAVPAASSMRRTRSWQAGQHLEGLVEAGGRRCAGAGSGVRSWREAQCPAGGATNVRAASAARCAGLRHR